MKLSKDSVITLTLFFTLTILLYLLGYWLIYRMAKATPLMMSVGLAAVLTCLIRKRSLSSLGWGWGSWKLAWMSYLIPLGMVAFAYLIIWVTGFGQWYDVGFVAEQKTNYNLSGWNDFSIVLFHFAITASISFFISLPAVLGEEIAWRGFLVPELSKFMNFTSVALFSGFVWAAWHWPLIIHGLYGNSTTALVYQLGLFTLFIMASSMIMTYLRYKSNSLWTAVIYHMSSNIFIQKFFTPLTLQDDQSSWYVDEFGLVLPLVVTLVAIYFYRKGQKEFQNRSLI